MKNKLLRIVRDNAHELVHLDSVSWSWNAFRVTGHSWTIGYATEEARDLYGDIMQYAMTEQVFDRKVANRYWRLNRQRYLDKYRKGGENGNKQKVPKLWEQNFPGRSI